MALLLPPAVTIDRFTGGYKSVGFEDLQDTETNDSQNIEYSPQGDLDKRLGSLRLLNRRLANTTATATGEPITGHYYFKKTDLSVTTHVVTAGNSVYQYNSATASQILSSQTDDSNTFYTFAQIEDPRSATDDIVIFSNGVDNMAFWNGSATAVALNSLTSASAVPLAKYILAHKNRIYAANIRNTANVDSTVEVRVSTFGSDGAPDPHRFPNSFLTGGAGRQGEITGLKVLNDQIIIYTRNSVWKFTPGSGNQLDTSSLVEMQESVGCLAPFSLVDCGGFHIFLSERGVYAFDGVRFTHISTFIDDDLLNNTNLTQLKYAKATFRKKKNHYVLYVPSQNSNRNDKGYVYDLRLKSWQPPITGRRVSYISTFEDSQGIERNIFGDYHGYLYQDDIGKAEHMATGFNGSAETVTVMGLTDNQGNFPTDGDGMAGAIVKIIEGTGEGQEQVILSNTSNTIALEGPWQTAPNTASVFTIGGIDAHWRSKDYDLGSKDLIKLFRRVRTRVREEGAVDLQLYYIIDFKDITRATSTLLRLADGHAIWGTSLWGSGVFGRTTTMMIKSSLRTTARQSTTGNFLSLRYSNRRANEGFRITGFDIELKQIGKR